MISYKVESEARIPSPALIYYRDVIEQNTAEAIRIAGGPERMWPHVKTHKMAELVRMQVNMGIRRFKCATVSEICMTAEAGAEHILWAYPVLGPNVAQFIALVKRYPDCTIYALEDDFQALEALNAACVQAGIIANVLLDVNIGMNRTGMQPKAVPEFYRKAAALPGVALRGLHCYDGHIHDHSLVERTEHASAGAAAAMNARKTLRQEGYDCGIVILGGTPTFPCHAEVKDVFLSPGTLFVSDYGYLTAFPDIGVIPAAAVLTRVISHPADGLFTLDTGVKAVSADANPRGVLVGLEDKCRPVLSSEEHWVFEMKPEYRSLRPAVGTVLYVIPTHVCPTTALYDAVYVCSEGKIVDIWKVAARDRVGAFSLEDVQ